MSVSEAKRRANNKWDAANMCHIACKMRRDVADEFRTLAERNGTNPNALIREWIMEYIQQHRDEEKS